ncbi:MAG TPA: DUF6022 family protein [Herpetosiphonaceae bacterium]|nr:DUF6022 family protein [Herpetosiphonaceae bacterium]
MVVENVLAALIGGDRGAAESALNEFIGRRWLALLEERRPRLLDAYERVGELAYGAYLELLFRPLNRAAKAAGIALAPRLPGDFNSSREWGADESDRQRWMWSGAGGPDGAALGTIVLQIHHDHTRFRLPRAPGALVLAETGGSVAAALAARSPEFAAAREASVEIAEYLEGLGRAG